MNVSSLIRIARALDVKPGVLIDDLDPEMFPEHGNVGRTL